MDTGVSSRVSKLKVEDQDDAFMDTMADFSGADIAMMDDMEILAHPAPSISAKNEEPSPTPRSSWLDIHSQILSAPPELDDKLVASGASSSHATNITVLEDDGSLRMFWLDYADIHGKLFLIGKVLDRTTSEKKYVSCCLTVEGLERNLFILPRERVHGKLVDLE
jgi:DNA polymerase alpha subunit A